MLRAAPFAFRADQASVLSCRIVAGETLNLGGGKLRCDVPHAPVHVVSTLSGSKGLKLPNEVIVALVIQYRRFDRTAGTPSMAGHARRNTAARIAELDQASYPSGVKVSDTEMAVVHQLLEPHDFHGDWNYTLRPPHQRTTPP